MHQCLWSGWLQARHLPKEKSCSPTQLLGRGNLWLGAGLTAREPGGQLECNPRSQEAEPPRTGGIRKSSLLVWCFLMPCAKCTTQETSEGWLTLQSPVCWRAGVYFLFVSWSEEGRYGLSSTTLLPWPSLPPSQPCSQASRVVSGISEGLFAFMVLQTKYGL